jgi:starvation-inducible DNA-binding protein
MTNKNVSNALKVVLADSYTLFLKTQNYHWNVTGPNFKSLHLMFEEQYNDLFIAIDLIAERIRALGEKAPATYAKYVQLTNIKEGSDNIDSNAMVKDLAGDQEVISKSLTSALKESQNIGDEVTAGIVADRIEIHQKNAWMLKSSL